MNSTCLDTTLKWGKLCYLLFFFPGFIALLFRKSCLPSRYLLSRIICPLLLEGVETVFFSERFGFHTRTWFKEPEFTKVIKFGNGLCSISLICFSVLSFSYFSYSPFLLVWVFLSWEIVTCDFLPLMLMWNNSHHLLSVWALREHALLKS